MNKVQIEPLYKSFDGWKQDISSIGNYADLPVQMKNYIEYLNGYLKVPVKYISNGPGRDQIVVA